LKHICDAENYCLSEYMRAWQYRLP
jgi:hypothetical protein